MNPAMIRHATLVFERLIPAPVGRVYQAYADVKLRSAWGAPTDTAVLIYDEESFRVGGTDRYRCGNKSNPNIHGTTIYLEIVPEERIVQVETIDRMAGGLRHHWSRWN